MTKLRKMMMTLVFVFAVVLGITAGTSNAKAASTKNFKGNLNVTYKNSDSKITIKKVNSKKVSIKIVYAGFAKFEYTGKITSKNTIKFNAVNNEEGYADVIFKWKGKSHFTSIWKEKRSNGFKYCSDELVFALDNTKYAQVKKSNTVYYNSYAGYKYTNASVKLKGNKLIVKGNLKKGIKHSVGEVKGNTSVLKKATRTFKLAKNFKAYTYNGYLEKYYKISKSDVGKRYNGGKNGLTFVLTVKNGKVTRIDFYS